MTSAWQTVGALRTHSNEYTFCIIINNALMGNRTFYMQNSKTAKQTVRIKRILYLLDACAACVPIERMIFVGKIPVS